MSNFNYTAKWNFFITVLRLEIHNRYGFAGKSFYRWVHIENSSPTV